MAVTVTRSGKQIAPGIGAERYLTHPEVSWIVCAECLMYHNTSWPAGEGPVTPLHVGCNCTRTPEVDLSFHDYAFWTKDAAFDKPSQPHEYLSRALKDMTRYEMERAFGGKTVAKLLANRVIKPEQAVTRTSGIKTLKQIAKDVPGLNQEKIDTMTLDELRKAIAAAKRKLARMRAKV